MDGREDQIVLVLQRHARLVARWRPADRASVRSETARGSDSPRRSARAAARSCIRTARVVVDWLRAAAHTRAGRVETRPASRAARPALARVTFHQRRPSLRPAAACGIAPAPRSGAARSPWRRARLPAPAGPTPGSNCSTRKPATRSRGFSTQRSIASMSLTWAGVEEFEPAELDEGNVAARQLDFERPRMARGAEQHRLLLERHAALASAEHLFDHIARLVGFIAHRHQLRLGRRLAARSTGSW